MDTSLNLPPTAAAVQAAPQMPRAVTTKVQSIEASENAATLPSNKPFVAQAVSAQLTGPEQQSEPSDIGSTERKLRPFGVPMLPYEAKVDQVLNSQSEGRKTVSA